MVILFSLALFCAGTMRAAGPRGIGLREVTPGPAGKAGFALMDSAQTGIGFTNELTGDAYLTNAVAHNGAGVAIGDVDRDGWPDIFFCNLQGPNRLYRNLGNWRFAESPLGDGACAGQFSTGAAFADVDGDRDLDLLVNGIASGTRLFLNDGAGNWTEKLDSGLSRTASATSLTLADIDGDGDLDLYCTHYIDVMHLADPTTRFALARRGDQWEVTRVNGESTRALRWKDRFEALADGSVRELPEVHGLYRNDGQGRFTPIQFEPGVFLNEQGAPIPPYRDWGLAAMFRDLNGDHVPDLYVCNDNASPDRIWINTGTGRFRAVDAMKFRHTSRSSMGLDVADIDRDGNDDLLVVDMLARDHGKRMVQLVKDRPNPRLAERIEEQPRYNRNTLFLGRADGSYVETAFMAGLAATDWSWCPAFVDVDLDGFEDVLITTGFSFDVMDQDSHDELRQGQRRMTDDQRKRSRQIHPHWPTPRGAYRNRQDGTFEPAAKEWGFDQTGVAYGMAFGDLDRDGDLDVVVNNLNAVASIYRNNAAAGRVAVRLIGQPPNSEAIGARLRLRDGSITQSQEMICGGRYLSGDQAMRVFATDGSLSRTSRLSLEVTWRNGDQSIISNIQPNHVYEIDQTQIVSRRPVEPTARRETYFADVSSLLDHVHGEDVFDDWLRQPLLPRRLSRLGPGVSWFDYDHDGWEDLVVAAGRGNKLTLFLNNQGNAFSKIAADLPALADQGAVCGWSDGRGNRSLLVAVSNYGLDNQSPSAISFYSPTNLSTVQSRPAGAGSLGPLALADIDGDGDLDLFVGGRFQPGRYPEPVSSAVWLNEMGELKANRQLSQPFESVGLVNGATFADLDGDGNPDLALALEWGPVRIYLNRRDRFEDVTERWGLGGSRGWWTGITAADFNGDGKLDLAVGNWGRNTIYELYRPGPLRIYYGDWHGDGTAQLVEAWRRGDQWLPIRDRTGLAAAIRDLPQRFKTHQIYSQATVPELLGALIDKARTLDATELDSVVLLNQGAGFQRLPLPREAQVTPVFSINAGDFDGDGIEDLFLSQNFYGALTDLSRDDNGRGLWLRGIGNGTFAALDALVTGISIPGEQRGAALADFNHDGRLDLAVSQNSGSTKLFVNRHARPGLRVVLKGPPSNPDAVGAQLRVRYADNRAGPVRGIQAGSGYWSQDASVQVLGLAGSAVSLWVRWPGGKEQVIPLPEPVREIQVTPNDERPKP